MAGCCLPQIAANFVCDPTIVAASRNASAGVSTDSIKPEYSQKHIPTSPKDIRNGICVSVPAKVMNVTGERVIAAMKEVGIDQPGLADALKVSQGSISKIVSGKTRNSRLMPRIAVLLGKSLPYLLGESDDPVGVEGQPAINEHHVLMRVVLPPQEALEAMFRGLIRSMPDLSGDDLARELARLLPTGFAQLQGPMRFERRDDIAVPPAIEEGQHDANRGRRRA